MSLTDMRDIKFLLMQYMCVNIAEFVIIYLFADLSRNAIVLTFQNADEMQYAFEKMCEQFSSSHCMIMYPWNRTQVMHIGFDTSRFQYCYRAPYCDHKCPNTCKYTEVRARRLQTTVQSIFMYPNHHPYNKSILNNSKFGLPFLAEKGFKQGRGWRLTIDECEVIKTTESKSNPTTQRYAFKSLPEDKFVQDILNIKWVDDRYHDERNEYMQAESSLED